MTEPWDRRRRGSRRYRVSFYGADSELLFQHTISANTRAAAEGRAWGQYRLTVPRQTQGPGKVYRVRAKFVGSADD